MSRRLIFKSELLCRVGVSYTTIWRWMRAGAFPRSRAVGQRSAWLSDEVERWLDQRPTRPLKGDGASASS